MRGPLVAGEQPSPLERLLVVADVGNGVSAVLDWREYLFINTELTVHLLRPPEGEWIGVDAVTRLDGVGLAESDAVGRARAHRPRRPDAARARRAELDPARTRPGRLRPMATTPSSSPAAPPASAARPPSGSPSTA